MRLLAYFRSLVSGFADRGHADRDMDEEFRAHIERYADDLERSGLSHKEALRRARIEFGGDLGHQIGEGIDQGIEQQHGTTCLQHPIADRIGCGAQVRVRPQRGTRELDRHGSAKGRPRNER